MRLRIVPRHLDALRWARSKTRIAGAWSASALPVVALLCFGLPLQAQVGVSGPPARSATVVDPRHIDQTIRGAQAPTVGSTVPGAPEEPGGTFIADVSRHVHADFSNLTTDLRKAIDNTDGNAREKLISLNERISKISNNFVDRAGETRNEARERLGEIRAPLNAIRDDLTTLTGETTGDARQHIVVVGRRVDALRSNLESATESRYNGTLGDAIENVKSQVSTAEDRARIAAAEVKIRTQIAVDDLQRKVAGVVRDPASLVINSHEHARLGVAVQQGAAAMTVTSVLAGSVAAQIGLRPGDQIFAINRRRIINYQQMIEELAAAAQGDGNALITIRRNGTTQEFQANLNRAMRNTAPTNSVR